MYMDIITRPFRAACIMLAALTVVLSSCSGDDYVNAVPDNSIAVLSLDMRRLAEGKADKGDAGDGLLNDLLQVENAGDCGIDLSEKMYMFESAEGNLGMVAKVESRSELEKWLGNLANAGVCRNIVSRGGFCFAILKDSWIVGASSDAVMVMGPVIASQYAEVQQMMMKYLEQDEERGIKSSPFYGRLDSIDAPVALVARAKALPEKFAAPFMTGAPEDADASQIVIAAGLSAGQGGLMRIAGETFSFNAGIDRRLKEAYAGYRPITDEFLENIDASSLFALFMNVDGGKYISMLHDNKPVQVLLAGLNMAVDMDNIIRSVDGDMVLASSGYDGDMMQVQLGARLKKRDFLADVPYWKQSCPAGCSISDWGKDAYRYDGGGFDFYFGVSADGRFYAGSTAEMARGILEKSSAPLSAEIRAALRGQRLGLMLNVAEMKDDNETVGAVTALLRPVVGNVDITLYTVK